MNFHVRARARETYQVHSHRCGRLRSGNDDRGWVSRKRFEGGVATASGGEKERERREWSRGRRRWEATVKWRGLREN
ncbi:hypothetical protein TIFTF001_030725 [Ficus carica]|uniref:Uncharacterized protein n=1 Tax=Ficus carica TaxID=3494 RepID=A0AA88DTR9_FICCA|nr:hypothetical protein TIFTF001_030725 [Ficus carica]